MALICTVVVGFVLVSVRQEAIQHRTQHLYSQAVTLGEQLRHGNASTLAPVSSQEALQVIDPGGDLVAASPNMAGKPPMTRLRPDPDAYTTTTACNGQVYDDHQCAIVLTYPVHRHDGVWQLNIAVPNVPWYVGGKLLAPLATGWLLMVATSAAGAYRIVGRTLRPVSAITDKLAQITASDLDQRVPVPPYRDELRDLAETANSTLQRAQSAVEQQLRFASDASHDLRSPLAAMRTQIEEALTYPHHTDWPQTADALLRSVEHAQALVADLLQTARLDAGVTGRREVIDLTALVRDEIDRRPGKSGKPALRHSLAPGVIVDGERLALTRLLDNLLDNAERHAASLITVTLTQDAGTAVLEVRDNGEGIAPDQREIIFQRFTRLEASRAKDTGGTGLGLPIARQIAHSHNGTLTAEDSPRGARFVLRIPARTTPQPHTTKP
ncbi:HAMP domain-containing histidine kinase [Actinomadura geliboluensis]|uniref:histidine kinase n=2 Tax=Actinomadura geliboluensis TaxID=882440 RepID=A0A5S4GN08_9ACTN|nr:HAMP domain-containing histidine kinase [Actinomadura geliboluensis]